MIARRGLQADIVRQLAQRRRHQAAAIGQHDHRIVVAGLRRRDFAGDRGPRRIEPAEKNPVAQQEIAQLVARDVHSMPDDGDALRWRFLGQRAQAREALRHGRRQLGGESLAGAEQVRKVAAIELRDARGLERTHAGDRGRPQQQRQFTEVVARAVGIDLPIVAVHDLAHVERAVDHQEKRRLLAFLHQPFAGIEANVGKTRGQRDALRVR